MVSYADFITLLFALFVVLFAASNADKEKVHKFARAVENALAHSGVRQAKADIQPPHPALDSTYSALVQSLRTELQNEQITLRLNARGLVISLNQSAFFCSGSAEFEPAMYPTLAKIASAIQQINNPVRLEGHTDSRPIHNDRFQNNWELSSARAITVLELLTVRFGMAQSRMAVAGYADTAPVSPNDTEQGRARNRRVDIVVLSPEATRSEPGANL